jgi:hypothetical protein
MNKIMLGIIGVLVIALVWGFYHIKNLENKVAINDQNNAALLDSVRVLKTKNGELEAIKLALAGDKKELEKLAADLTAELKKEKGKVRVITKIDVQYKADSSINPSTVTMNDSVGMIRTDLEDSCRIFKGYASFVLSKGKVTSPSFVVERDEFNLKLITGLKERDKKLEIFVRSSCPGVTVRDIQGAVIDPNDPLIKPKKPLFTWRDALEITGGIALGLLISRY